MALRIPYNFLLGLRRCPGVVGKDDGFPGIQEQGGTQANNRQQDRCDEFGLTLPDSPLPPLLHTWHGK